MNWETTVKKKHNKIETKTFLFRGWIKKVDEILFRSVYSIDEKVNLILCDLHLISKILSSCPEVSYALSNNHGKEIETIIHETIDNLSAPQNITSLLLCVREMFFLLDTNIIGGLEDFVNLPYEFVVDPKTDIYRICYNDDAAELKRYNDCPLGIISIFEHYSISELARQI